MEGNRIMMRISDPIASDLDVVGINEYIGWYSHLPADADAAEMEIRLRQAADYERIRR
jgi:hypothetical protein